MDQDRVRTAVIVGSTREERFGDTIARWFVGRAAMDQTLDIDLIDLAEAGLSPVLRESPPPEVEAMRSRLALADAFVIVTPEYNHGYPASLKTALDWARDEWKAKPVSFVSYGGTAGGLRAVEQLRQVCAELHMVSTRDCVSFHMCHGCCQSNCTWRNQGKLVWNLGGVIIADFGRASPILELGRRRERD